MLIFVCLALRCFLIYLVHVLVRLRFKGAWSGIENHFMCVCVCVRVSGVRYTKCVSLMHNACELAALKLEVEKAREQGFRDNPDPKSLQRHEVNTESFMQRAFFVLSRNVIAINVSVSYLIVRYDHECLVYIQKQPFSMMIGY